MIDSGTASRRKRLTSVVAALAIGLFVIAGSAFAGTLATVKTYTGCLTVAGGTLTLIREGDSPAKPCPSGSVVARFSGGDITSVIAGTGLTGGGTNGDVTISLDPKYALRQDCAEGQVVKWNTATTAWVCANDTDTTYSAGTGLDLDTTEFSVARSYRLPQDCQLGDSVDLVFSATSAFGDWGCEKKANANQNCASGKFANGIDTAGDLKCATPSGGGAGGSNAYLGKQINPTAGNVEDDDVGILSDGADRTYATVTVPAGTYVLIAKGAFDTDGSIGTFYVPPECTLNGHDKADYGIQIKEAGSREAFSLMDVATSSGGAFNLVCNTLEDGISLHNSRIVAIKVG